MKGKGFRTADGSENIGRRRKRGVGTQLDMMKRVRKDMPPASKPMKEKNRIKPSTNWRDLLEDEDDFGGNDIGGCR